MKAIGHYSSFATAQGLGFTSGIVGNDHNGGIVAGLENQVSTALQNLATLLSQHELEINSIIKTTLFITDNNHYPTVDKIYKDFLGGISPARSTLIVSELTSVKSDGPESVLFEIEAVVSLGEA